MCAAGEAWCVAAAPPGQPPRIRLSHLQFGPDKDPTYLGGRTVAPTPPLHSSLSSRVPGQVLSSLSARHAMPPSLLFDPARLRADQELAAKVGRGLDGPVGHPTAKRARIMVERTAQDTSIFALRGDQAYLEGILTQVVQVKNMARNTKVSKSENSHWALWVKICDALDTPHWRTDMNAHSGRDPAAYERERTLLEIAAVIASHELRPKRTKQAPEVTEVQVETIKTFVRSVANVHKHKHAPPIEMVPVGALASLWTGMLHRFKAKFGVAAMQPKQKAPLRRDQIEAMLDTLHDSTFKASRTLKATPGAVWAASARAWIATSAQTGMRKADSLICGQDVFTVDDLSRGSISWLLNGTERHSWLTLEQLANLGPNDYIVIKPPPTKCDPFGRIWGTRPIYGRSPLFMMDDKAPMKGHFAEGLLLKLLKAQGLTAKAAGEYSCHSFRIYLACALRAANKTDAEIQALCRWSSLDSLRIYACLDARSYTGLVEEAMLADSTSVRVHQLPFLDLDDLDEDIPEAA